MGAPATVLPNLYEQWRRHISTGAADDTRPNLASDKGDACERRRDDRADIQPRHLTGATLLETDFNRVRIGSLIWLKPFARRRFRYRLCRDNHLRRPDCRLLPVNLC